ncbi:hypothetical protein NE236_37935 [Actinoallomurus purpureus]|uniref:hypothetical protein n=1 Tax=Actinoallomurus purpureus TaxID=478114 RepID=UPI002092D23E|nr:hypothetical protein [Actinoallomurus purpureus]MCO6010756.1 hypothetical protein [Actinoallomurus purpureus]
MRPHTSEEISAFAKWLTQACQEAGLRAEQYGSKVRIIASCHFLTEEVECRPDDAGALRWWWSWGKPIADRHDSARILTPDEVDDLVEAIVQVVAIPLKRWP